MLNHLLPPPFSDSIIHLSKLLRRVWEQVFSCLSSITLSRFMKMKPKQKVNQYLVFSDRYIQLIYLHLPIKVWGYLMQSTHLKASYLPVVRIKLCNNTLSWHLLNLHLYSRSSSETAVLFNCSFLFPWRNYISWYKQCLWATTLQHVWLCKEYLIVFFFLLKASSGCLLRFSCCIYYFPLKMEINASCCTEVFFFFFLSIFIIVHL